MSSTPSTPASPSTAFNQPLGGDVVPRFAGIASMIKQIAVNGTPAP